MSKWSADFHQFIERVRKALPMSMQKMEFSPQWAALAITVFDILSELEERVTKLEQQLQEKSK